MEGASGQQGRTSRIAATLLALAALAERAALRSLPVRFLVLTILWPAEAIARKFVAGEMEFDRQYLDDISRYDDDSEYADDDIDQHAGSDPICPAPRWPTIDELMPPTGATLDAELLALRLRLLAAILLALADPGSIHDDGGIFGDDFGWTPGHLRNASTAPALPLLLVITCPVARYGVIRPPDTS